MMQPFRLYFESHCPHCVDVLKQLTDAKVPVHLVEVGTDPVAQAGITKLLGMLQVPLLIYFPGAIAVLGNKRDEIDKVIATYFAEFSSNASDDLPSPGNAIQAPTGPLGAV